MTILEITYVGLTGSDDFLHVMKWDHSLF